MKIRRGKSLAPTRTWSVSDATGHPVTISGRFSNPVGSHRRDMGGVRRGEAQGETGLAGPVSRGREVCGMGAEFTASGQEGASGRQTARLQVVWILLIFAPLMTTDSQLI